MEDFTHAENIFYKSELRDSKLNIPLRYWIISSLLGFLGGDIAMIYNNAVKSENPLLNVAIGAAIGVTASLSMPYREYQKHQNEIDKKMNELTGLRYQDYLELYEKI